MNKKLLVTVVVLVLLYPLLAWAMGWVVQARSTAALAQLRDQAPYLTVVDNQYHRGWYTSEQDLKLSLFAAQMAGLAPLAGANAQAVAKGVQVTLHSVIHHGPFCGRSCFALARVESHLVLSNEAKAAVTLIYGSADPLTIDARLGFFGGGTTTITSPAISEKALPGDAAKLSWDGFKFTVSYTRHHDAYKVDGSMPHLLVDGMDGKRFEIKDVSFRSNSTRALGSIYASDFDAGIDTIAYAGVQGSSPLLLHDFKYTGKASVDSGFISYAMQIDTGSLAASGVKLKDAYFDFSFKHLDLVTLEALNDKIRAIYNTSGTGAKPDATAMAGALKQQGLALLLKQPVLSLDRVGLDTANGQVRVSGMVSIPGVTAADLASDAGIAALAQKLVADFDVSIDDSALSELPGTDSLQQQLQTMAQQGYFTHDNGRWHAAIHSAQGQATFNGKPFQAAALAQPPAPAPAPPPNKH